MTAKLLLVELKDEAAKAAISGQEAKASVQQLENLLEGGEGEGGEGGGEGGGGGQEGASTSEAAPGDDNAASATPTAAAASATPTTAQPAPPGGQCEFIGYDQNTHKKTLPTEKEAPPPKSVVEEGSSNPPSTPDTRKAFEALASVGILKQQLVDTEKRAQEAERRVTELEEK